MLAGRGDRVAVVFCDMHSMCFGRSSEIENRNSIREDRQGNNVLSWTRVVSRTCECEKIRFSMRWVAE